MAIDPNTGLDTGSKSVSLSSAGGMAPLGSDPTGAAPGTSTTPNVSAPNPSPSSASNVAVPGTATATPPAPNPNTPVANNLNGLLTQGNPYIEQAKSAGLDTANQRGVLNSSIAAGASEGAAIAAAAPIATSDAQITATGNIAKDQNATTLAAAKLSADTQTKIAGMNIDASAKQQAASILANAQLQASQLTSQQDIAKLQSDTQIAIQQMNISDADKQQLLSLATQQNLADTQQSTSLQVANMNVASDQQDKAAAAAQNYASVYASMVNNINSNTSIPADARQSYLDNAKTLYSNGMSLVEQTYNVQLDWGQAA